MVSSMHSSLCTGCGVCEHVCPKKCITMQRDEAGFLYPKIEESECIHCNVCDKMCHVQNMKVESVTAPDVYIGYNKDEEQRMKSSSGGIFVLIADTVIENGGIVYGASFADDFSVKHIRVDDKESVHKLQGSKYVQSTVEPKLYGDIENELKKGKKVLFSGTPCQVGALKKYLGKQYSNLISVSFICHGVPSPRLWMQYCEWQREKYQSEIKEIFHRNKDKGWVSFSMKIGFENKKSYRKTLTKDPYLQLFLKNTCLRESCHSCSYKGKDKLACVDILLADKWGKVSGQLPDMEDDKGISLVFVSPGTGQEYWRYIKDKMYYDKTDFTEAVLSNTAYEKSSVKSRVRSSVIKEIGNTPVDELYRKYAKTPLKRSVLNFTKKKAYKVAKKLGVVSLVRKVKGR